MIETLHLRISGKVQGVFFRQTTIETANKIGGISGFVRNLADGTVEVLAKGEKVNLDALLAFCKKGPSLALVTNVEILANEDDSLPKIEEGLFRKEKTI